MGPRPNGRGKVNPGDCRLCVQGRQWGRGQTAAESPTSFEKTTVGSVRQWGRGQTAAESAIARPPPIWDIRRQWGRGQTAAESGRACRRRSHTHGRVNGAAAKRPRKVGVPRKLMAGFPRRQWGRGQTAAESRRTARRACRPPGVNGAAAKRPRKGLIILRPPAVILSVNGAAAKRPRKGLAERPRVDALGRQWGRGQTAAESRTAGRAGGAGRQASMGPRPNGRGKAEDVMIAGALAGVNGAAAKRPRKG